MKWQKAEKIFPFLKGMIDSDCIKVTVERNFKKWASRRPYYYYDTGELIERLETQTVALVFWATTKGIIKDAIKQHGYHRAVDISREETFQGETLAEGLYRQGISPGDLHAVVWRTDGVREVDCFSGPEYELRVILP